jgi:hypothetical protein
MALKYSTGLRNFLVGEGSLRKAFEDGVLNIYSGAAPANADEAPTGVLLAKITKASGALAVGARSTPKRYKVVIGSHAEGQTFPFALTVDGVGPTTFTYTNTPDAGDAEAVAKAVARMLNDLPQLMAIAEGANGALYVQSRIDGLDFTLADAGGGTGTITSITQAEAASSVNSLRFGSAAAGALAKNADVWSGVGLANGVAGYFRLVNSQDTGLLSTTDIRIQGTISTSGADLNMSSLNIALGATQTIDQFQLTFPASN